MRLTGFGLAGLILLFYHPRRKHSMNMKEIKEIAAERGVMPGKMRKAELIRAIQKAEDNPECFAIGLLAHCVEYDCLWRGDCS